MRRGSAAAERAHWKAIYEEVPYDQLPWFDSGPSPSVVRAVAEGFFPSKGAILDIGCGAGSNVIFLARKGFEAHGIDLSPGAIRAAEERAKAAGMGVDVRVGDVLALDFPDRRFDGVIDNGCFHTLPVSRRHDYAKEVVRILRPGGSFVIAWVAREYTEEMGPPHRPSVNEVAATLERHFLFRRTEFHPPEKDLIAMYDAWLTRRTEPQPEPR